MYMAMAMAAGPLMVIDVVTLFSSMPANRSSMSARVSTATPARPTSPTDHSWSESRPMSVGMSNAVDNPVPPARSRAWNRSLVSVAVPNPANMRMVHNLPPVARRVEAPCVGVIARLQTAAVGRVEGDSRHGFDHLEILSRKSDSWKCN